jgi:hypothetical protein
MTPGGRKVPDTTLWQSCSLANARCAAETSVPAASSAAWLFGQRAFYAVANGGFGETAAEFRLLQLQDQADSYHFVGITDIICIGSPRRPKTPFHSGAQKGTPSPPAQVESEAGCPTSSFGFCGRVGVPRIPARLAALSGFMARTRALRDDTTQGGQPSASPCKAWCKPGASQEIGRRSLVFLLCCSCAPLVLPLTPRGVFGGTAAVSPSPCLSLTALPCPLFKCNRIFQ